jgi:hypothetical protein
MADPTGLAQQQLSVNAAGNTGPNFLEQAGDYFDKMGPFQKGATMYMGANMLGLLNPSNQTFGKAPYSGSLTKYRMSPDFQGSTATPNVYRPTYPSYADGGVTGSGNLDLHVPISLGGGAGGGGGFGGGGYQAVGSGGGGQTGFSGQNNTNFKNNNTQPPPGMFGSMMPFGGQNGQPFPHLVQEPMGGLQGYQQDAAQRQKMLGQGAFTEMIPPQPAQAARPFPDPYVTSYAPQSHQMKDQSLKAGGAVRYADGGIMNINPVQAMSDQNNMLGYQQAAQATGGQVAHFARGGRSDNLADSLDYYKSMMESRASAPAERGDVGIYRDTNISTRNEDALTAAQIRNAQVAKRANMQLPEGTGQLARPTPMGQLNLRPPGVKADAGSASVDTENAAAGGIMGASSLGGYAAGGNPRLLKGPGDGMSDNIPAVIGQRQPARLADGEFVIPADVVSHLGNGSTEAGAKRLHEMMNKVRKERTGNSRQGKQIVASKYMPK